MFKTKQQKALDTLKECLDTIKKAQAILQETKQETMFPKPISIKDFAQPLLQSPQKECEECEVCGFQSKTKSGLGIHKSKIHKTRAKRYEESKKYYLKNKRK